MTFKGYHILIQTELLCLQLRLSNIFHYKTLFTLSWSFATTYPSLRSYPLFFHCFWKLSRSCSVIWNSIVMSVLMRFFPAFSSWIATLKTPSPSQSLKKEVEMWEAGWFWGKNRAFCCPCRNAPRFSQVVIPQWCWWVLTDSFVPWARWASTALLTPASQHSVLPPGFPPPRTAPSRARGSRTWDQPTLGRESMLAKQPNAELPANHSLKCWGFHFILWVILCSVVRFLLSLPQTMLYCTTLSNFIYRYNCTF